MDNMRAIDGYYPIKKCIFSLDIIDDDQLFSLQSNEATKNLSKATFDRQVCPCSFSEGDLILDYGITHDALGLGMLETL
jgi:hypothetical protein